MARVVRFHRLGGPEVLEIEELDVGRPEAGEMRVRIEAIGLNRAEAMFRSGTYLEQPLLPARIGYEASAVVDVLGSDAQGFEIGQPVNVIPAFSLNKYGTYAEEAIVPASAVVPRPVNVSEIEAAAVWMQYLTAYGALSRHCATHSGRCGRHHGGLEQRGARRHPDCQQRRGSPDCDHTDRQKETRASSRPARATSL